MKSYDEMTEYILNVRDEYERRKQKRLTVIRRTALAFSCICAAFLTGISVRNIMKDTPPSQLIISENEIVTTAESTSSDRVSETTNAVTYTETSQSISEKTETAVQTQTALQTYISDTQFMTTTVITTAEMIFETPAVTTETTEKDGETENIPIETPPVHWEEMTVSQQYFMAEFGEPVIFYHTKDKTVSADEIGEFISSAYMSGYDFYTETNYHCYAYAYKINGYSEEEVIAVKFEDDESYYLYTK